MGPVARASRPCREPAQASFSPDHFMFLIFPLTRVLSPAYARRSMWMASAMTYPSTRSVSRTTRVPLAVGLQRQEWGIEAARLRYCRGQLQRCAGEARISSPLHIFTRFL